MTHTVKAMTDWPGLVLVSAPDTRPQTTPEPTGIGQPVAREQYIVPPQSTIYKVTSDSNNQSHLLLHSIVIIKHSEPVHLPTPPKFLDTASAAPVSALVVCIHHRQAFTSHSTIQPRKEAVITVSESSLIYDILLFKKYVRSSKSNIHVAARRKWSLSSAQSAKETTSNANPIIKEWGKDSTNYCFRHLFKPDAPVKCTDQNGADIEELNKACELRNCIEKR